MDIALGDNNQARQWLEKGYKARDIHMVFLKVDARWDSLRAQIRTFRICCGA
jgi:hypothetical protein